MSDTEYGAALKLGKKQYQDAVAKGEYPYLPVLDDVLSYTDIVSTVSLGTMDIPLAKLVGTKTAERSNSFANNFMPLLPERSEFGIKWLNLYNHQVEDGIQDPIVAYEFMNRFYVQEGNKRVSVMKYLGAYSIPGTVTRLIPKRTDDLENRLYYEFLDFYKVSSNCDVWFSKEGRYKELLKLMGMKPDQVWEEEERNLMTEEELKNKIATLTGGRCAEELVFGSVTTGASNDIEQATKLSRAMITRYGMSSRFGMVALETQSNPYLGGDSSLSCSPETAATIDDMVVDMVKQSYEKARKLLKDNQGKLHELAKYLYEKETITGDEFMRILSQKELSSDGETASGAEFAADGRQILEEEKASDKEVHISEE